MRDWPPPNNSTLIFGLTKFAPPASPHRAAVIANAFEEVLMAIRTHRPELSSVDISRALEIVADRYTVAMATPEFSRATIEYKDAETK